MKKFNFTQKELQFIYEYTKKFESQGYTLKSVYRTREGINFELEPIVIKNIDENIVENNNTDQSKL